LKASAFAGWAFASADGRLARGGMRDEKASATVIAMVEPINRFCTLRLLRTRAAAFSAHCRRTVSRDQKQNRRQEPNDPAFRAATMAGALHP
jgi:hypothetical protein